MQKYNPHGQVGPDHAADHRRHSVVPERPSAVAAPTCRVGFPSTDSDAQGESASPAELGSLMPLAVAEGELHACNNDCLLSVHRGVSPPPFGSVSSAIRTHAMSRSIHSQTLPAVSTATNRNCSRIDGARQGSRALRALARISHQALVGVKKLLGFTKLTAIADDRADCGLRWPRPRRSFGPVYTRARACARAPSSGAFSRGARGACPSQDWSPAMLSVGERDATVVRTEPKSSAIITAPGEKCGLVPSAKGIEPIHRVEMVVVVP